MTKLHPWGALVRASLVAILVLWVATPAQAALRDYEVRWIPQGPVVADGYDLYLRVAGSSNWNMLNMGFVPIDNDGIARYEVVLNDDVDYELALRAYIYDGATKVASALSNVVDVPALVVAECAVDADCSDADVCNGAESCVSGTCVAGNDLACADPGPCQAALCDAVQGCVVVADPGDPACQPDPEPDPTPDPDPEPTPDPDPTPDPEPTPDPDPAPGSQGVSVDLDGAGEQLGTPGQVRLGIGTEFTLSMWVKPTGHQSGQVLFEAFSPGGNAGRIFVIARNGEDFDPIRVATFGHDGRRMQARDYEGWQRPGEWLHVVATQNAGGDHLTVYFDGEAATPDNVLTDSRGRMPDLLREVVLGVDSTRLVRFFHGQMGHVALWNRQLSAAEVAEVHAGAHEIDLRQDRGSYVSASNLRHYWRLGETPASPGMDYVTDAPVHLDQTVGIDASDVVNDAP